ncbi:SGNH/GDSL hydrolase family protein [Polycladomyces subterraneus]|uniref:SGNH/GDSL hydrolase family protein n=1 Tax=Polycladomyces subterraneus TaxID=1016997 RepID=A0ABT8IMF6_9BACL|nr:SGNH/GDSL hydrolase family protein [Polycladomyces subterraneus]MDN4593905.1 SGNH/GDSL hydrolase family protein [Polycladomyces subterraneus]
MKIKPNPVWFLVSMISCATLLLFAVGFVLGVEEVLSPPDEPAFPASAGKQEPTSVTAGNGLLVGMGDSLTRGTGDLSGKGYIGYVRDALEKQTRHPIGLVNLAVKGQTSTQLAQQTDEPRVRQLLRSARWITFTIGGNDLFRESGGPDRINTVASEQGLRLYERNLQHILDNIRKYNPNAPVFVFGLYNPFGNLTGKTQTSHLILEWNDTLQRVANQYPRVVVVPTFDLFQLNPDRYLYTDHFHPNSDGYRLMAQRLIQVMNPSSGGDTHAQ